MKHLLICRHAKSPWAALSVADHDRELNNEGFKEASDMGARLLDRKVFFDLILTSSATRALTTSQLIASEVKYPLGKIKTDKKIYGADVALLKEIISSTDKKVSSLAVFGHNPALTFFANELSNVAILKFPTCAMLSVSIDADSWKNCFNSSRETNFFDFPGKSAQ